MTTGTCSVHSWNDGAEDDEAEPKMGLRVNQRLHADPALYATPPERSRSARFLGGRLLGRRFYVEASDE
jgi:WD repeat-containing protein 23